MTMSRSFLAFRNGIALVLFDGLGPLGLKRVASFLAYGSLFVPARRDRRAQERQAAYRKNASESAN